MYFKIYNSVHSFLSARKKRTKESIPPTKAFPQGKDATAPTRRSFIKVSSTHQRVGLVFLSAGASLVLAAEFFHFLGFYGHVVQVAQDGVGGLGVDFIFREASQIFL